VKQALILSLLLIGGAGCESRSPIVADTSAFPALTGRVVDHADLLTPGEEMRLAAKSASVEKEVGPQYVIVTLTTLGGRPIEDYGVDLGRHWGIGHKGKDDGLLLIVAPRERKVRIEVGKGLERRVTDPYAGRVIREQALPNFKANRFGQGIEATSDALIARLRSKASDAQIRREDGVVT
jgi:uncharacterized protein